MAGDKEFARLRDQMEQTKALYDGAKQEYDRALKRMNDLGMTHPDGTIRHATTVYRYTLANYRIALRDYNRFLLSQTSPIFPPRGTTEVSADRADQRREQSD